LALLESGHLRIWETLMYLIMLIKISQKILSVGKMGLGTVAKDKFESGEDLEGFLHDIYSPLYNPDVWDSSRELEDVVDARAESYRISFSDLSDDKKEYSSRQWFEQYPDAYMGTELSHGRSKLKIRPESSENDLVIGILEHHPDSIDSGSEAEEGTLLYELRNAYQRVADFYENGYVAAVDDLNAQSAGDVPNECWPEIVASFTLPVDYDDDTYRTTVESLTAIATGIQDVDDEIISVITEYDPSQNSEKL